MSEDEIRSRQAASFDQAADTYERARPSYPDEAVDWLLASHPQDALDLGAGTGKLTRLLVGRVGTIHAVDPSPKMLEQLIGVVPEAITAVGTAEAIPLGNASVDAVLAAQAWHWVDPARAVPEVQRVLRPGGVRGLIWNVRDETVPWVWRLTEIMHGLAAERFVAEGQGIPDELGPVERLTLAWERPFDRASLLDLVASRSYVITLADPARAELLAEVSDLLDTHPDLTDPAQWRIPYVTEAFRIRAD